MANETRSVTEVVPYVGMVVVGFIIAGYVSFALYNGVANQVYPWPYTHFGGGQMTLFTGWMGAWALAGLVIGVYYGRK